MERHQAIERVRKLREIRVDRGATQHEAKVAKRKADVLIARFSLTHIDISEPAPVRRPPIPQPAPFFPFANAPFVFFTSTSTGGFGSANNVDVRIVFH